MSLELKWFIYVLIQHEITTPEFALTLLARLGQNDTTLEVYAQQLFELLAKDAEESDQSVIMQQIQSFIEYTLQQAELGEEPPEIFELEIVEDEEEENAFELYEQEVIFEEEIEKEEEEAPNSTGGFDPFAGRRAAPVTPPPAPAKATPVEIEEEEEFEDENEFEDSEPPIRNSFESTAKPNFAKPDFAEKGSLHTSMAEARANSSIVEPEEADTNDGPSVEDIVAMFIKKHGVEKVEKKKRIPVAPSKATSTLATETTKSLKKVRIDAKVFNKESNEPKVDSPEDTVPLSLPQFFTDTAYRTLKLEGLPQLDNLESKNAGECAPLLMDIIAVLRRNHVSDLYINAGEPLFVRRLGVISYLETAKLSAKAAEQLNYALLNSDQKSEFIANSRLAFALALRDGRCRCNLRKQFFGVSGCYHLAPAEIKSLEKLGFLPNDARNIHKMLDAPSGLIVVAGPAGSGRTTTLAAMVDYISKNRAGEITMLESPIEIIQDSALGDVIQREVGSHTVSTNIALKATMRQDTNVIVLSEIYNQDTIERALRAAELGRLVIVAMHATNTHSVLARLTRIFDTERSPEIMAMLSGNLRGIVVQKLIDSKEDDTQTAIYELMTNSPKMASLLVDGKLAGVSEAIRSGREKGMCSFDNNVIRKYRAGDITAEVAQNAIHHPEVREKVELEVAITEARKLLAARNQN